MISFKNLVCCGLFIFGLALFSGQGSLYGNEPEPSKLIADRHGGGGHHGGGHHGGGWHHGGGGHHGGGWHHRGHHAWRGGGFWWGFRPYYSYPYWYNGCGYAGCYYYGDDGYYYPYDGYYYRLPRDRRVIQPRVRGGVHIELGK